MSQYNEVICYYLQDVLRKGVIQTITDEMSRKVEELYEVYEQPMYRLAYGILHHVQQAEDAVHDAFVAIMKSKAEIGDARSPETKKFVVQTIKNTAINRDRKNARDSEYYAELDERAEHIPDSHNDVEQSIKQMEQSETVRDLLSGLSESDREILMLRCCDELSFTEIAERLSLKEPTVRKRYERARKAAGKQKGSCNYAKKLFTV